MLTLVVCIAVVATFVNNIPSSSARRLGTIPTAFTLTMMGSRRGKGGNLSELCFSISIRFQSKHSFIKIFLLLPSERNLDDAPGVKSAKSGRGQEITGVTLPENG